MSCLWQNSFCGFWGSTWNQTAKHKYSHQISSRVITNSLLPIWIRILVNFRHAARRSQASFPNEQVKSHPSCIDESGQGLEEGAQRSEAEYCLKDVGWGRVPGPGSPFAPQCRLTLGCMCAVCVWRMEPAKGVAGQGGWSGLCGAWSLWDVDSALRKRVQNTNIKLGTKWIFFFLLKIFLKKGGTWVA